MGLIKIKSTVVLEQDADNDDFKAPSNYYILNALGELVFYQTRSRAIAQTWANEEYNGKYTIRLWKIK